MSRNAGLRIILLLAGLGVATYSLSRSRAPAPPPAPTALPPSRPAPPQATDNALLTAIRQRRSNVWGIAVGTVVRLLPDDRKGIPHQRFVIRLETGTTLLLDYNIDLAPRITPLEIGDTVVARGRYVWNEQGGLIHWLHHDPSGAPGGGWVRVRGRVFQ